MNEETKAKIRAQFSIKNEIISKNIYRVTTMCSHRVYSGEQVDVAVTLHMLTLCVT